MKMRLGLQWIDFFFKRSLRMFFRRPKTVLSFLFAALIVFGRFATGLNQVVTIEDQLDPSMKSTEELKRAKALFGSESTLGFIVQPKGDHFKPSELCQIQKNLNEMVYVHPEIESFMTPFKIRQAVQDGDHLTYFRYLESPCETGEEVDILKKLQPTIYDTLLIDRDSRDFSVALKVKDLETPGKYGTFDPEAVKSLIEDFKKAIPFKHWVTGTSAQQLFLMEGMGQSQMLNLLVLLVILVSFRFLFGTWRSGGIFTVTMLISGTFVFGTMGMLNLSMDPLSSCLFLMLAVSSIQDFVFLSYHRMSSPWSYKKSFRAMITPGFFTSFTTMLGFGSLMVSDLHSIRQFGGMACLGSLLEWICVFLVLPSFMEIFPSWQKWLDPEKSFLRTFSTEAISYSPPKKLIYLSMVVFVAAGYSIKNFRMSQTPSEIFPSDHPFQQGMEYIKQTRGWVADASLIFENGVSDSFKENILKSVREDSLIAKTFSFNQLNDFVSANLKDQSMRELVSFELKFAPAAQEMVADSGEERVILFLKTTNTRLLNDFRDKISSLCPNQQCWVAGEFIGFADFSKSLIKTLFESLFASLILVGLVVFYLTRAMGKKHFFPVVISAIWGPAWLLVGIYAFDLSINFVTCIVASTLIGLTGDNAIQYMFGATEAGEEMDKGIEDRGIGSIQVGMIMALCCLMLTFSYFEPPRTLGILLSAGFVLALFGDLWVLKALLPKKN